MSEALYWNSWLSREHWRLPVQRAQDKENYFVYFDLSAFDYAKIYGLPIATAVADKVLRDEVREVMDRESTLRLRYKPFILGHGLKFMPGQGRAGELTVDVKVLQARLNLEPGQVPPGTVGLAQEVFQDLADRAGAARITVGVTAAGEGCAAVGVSIWNLALNRPLDYLVRYVPVGETGEVGNCAKSGPSARPLAAGLSSMRSLEAGGKADAALHLFEIAFDQTTEAAAVFVGGEPPEVLSWRPPVLSEYASNDTGLAERLTAARTAHDYTVLGRELRQKLFFDSDEGTGADEALAILRGLAARRAPEPPATVFFRLVDVSGQSLFLPIGLLDLGDNALLCDHATVVLPLPKEHAHRSDGCIARWTMVLPDALGNSVESEFMTPVGEEVPGRIRTWSEFSAYISPTGTPTAPSKAEGFLLLAHHGGGRVSFAPGSLATLSPEGITRKFAPGSVAFLAACGMGALSKENRSLPFLSKINDRGIDGVVLSSFPVSGPVGARFAFQFANEVGTAQRNHERATLSQLFRRAVENTRNETALGWQRDEVLEFVVVGDAGLALCGSEEGP